MGNLSNRCTVGRVFPRSMAAVPMLARRETVAAIIERWVRI
jgi:hypothetical protein